jgi:hypothetical protein
VGQQQLLTQALAAVIVSLTVAAGFETFDQEQRQAIRDALVQRAVSIGTDVLAVHRKPSQLGGIGLGSTTNDKDVARAAGLVSTSQLGSGIPAEGAGESATCDLDVITGEPVAYVDCGSKQTSQGYPSGLVVKVLVDPNAEKKVKVIDVGEDVDHNN